MEQFLQDYGIRVLLGLFFVVMLRTHAGGGHQQGNITGNVAQQDPEDKR